MMDETWAVRTGNSFGINDRYVVSAMSGSGIRYAVCGVYQNDIDNNELRNAELIALAPEMVRAIMSEAEKSHECLTPGDNCIVCMARKLRRMGIK